MLLTSVALSAVTALLGACSEDGADADTKADKSSSSAPTDDGSPATDASTAPAGTVDLPDGVLPLPEPGAGGTSVELSPGRYRIPLDGSLAFDIDLPGPTTAHDDGLFLATDSYILKTEIAGDEYGVPRHPCSDQTIEPVGPTVEDLVEAMGDLPAYEVSGAQAVELGGGDGFYLEARVPRGYDASACEGDGTVQLPGNPATAVSGPPPYVGGWWVLDVDGQRVVVQQNCWGCTAEELADAPKIFESMSFTPTT